MLCFCLCFKEAIEKIIVEKNTLAQQFDDLKVNIERKKMKYIHL